LKLIIKVAVKKENPPSHNNNRESCGRWEKAADVAPALAKN